jgi:hypothetical protein
MFRYTREIDGLMFSNRDNMNPFKKYNEQLILQQLELIHKRLINIEKN